MKRTALIVTILAGVVGLGLWWFFASFHQEPRTVKTPPSPRALADDFLALTQTLQELGFKPERTGPGDRFWERPIGLVFTDERFLNELDHASSVALSRWLRSGGRLVVFWGTTDPRTLLPEGVHWLGRYGITVTLSEEAAHEKSEEGSLEPYSGETTLVVHWDPRVNIESETEDEQGNPFETGWEGKSLRWIRKLLGDGWVAFTGDGSWFSNTELGKVDHARFLAHLTDGLSTGTRVAVATNTVNAGHLPESWIHWLIASGVFALFLVWAFARRFGPPIEVAVDERRSLKDRFSAEGRFLWKRAPRGTWEEWMRASYLKQGRNPQVLAKFRKPHLNKQEFIRFMNELEEGRKLR